MGRLFCFWQKPWFQECVSYWIGADASRVYFRSAGISVAFTDTIQNEHVGIRPPCSSCGLYRSPRRQWRPLRVSRQILWSSSQVDGSGYPRFSCQPLERRRTANRELMRIFFCNSRLRASSRAEVEEAQGPLFQSFGWPDEGPSCVHVSRHSQDCLDELSVCHHRGAKKK